jgi:hypothetical protein
VLRSPVNSSQYCPSANDSYEGAYGEESEPECGVTTPNPSRSSSEGEDENGNHESRDTGNGHPRRHWNNVLVRLCHPNRSAGREARDQSRLDWALTVPLSFTVSHIQEGQ